MAKPHLLVHHDAYCKTALSHAAVGAICFEQRDIESLKSNRHMAVKRPEVGDPHRALLGPEILDSQYAKSDGTSEAVEHCLRAPPGRIRPTHWCSRRVAAPDAGHSSGVALIFLRARR
jgi:hypothetical protein